MGQKGKGQSCGRDAIEDVLEGHRTACLQCVDEEDEQLARVVKKKRRGEVPELLIRQHDVLRHVDCVDVAKLHRVPEHFAVNHADA